uniref:Ovule protein n=1 Tax=Strongyloides venezuelensis TaxID=75913 RepID=A0A0K0FYU2_STRVS
MVPPSKTKEMVPRLSPAISTRSSFIFFISRPLEFIFSKHHISTSPTPSISWQATTRQPLLSILPRNKTTLRIFSWKVKKKTSLVLWILH